MHGLVNHIIKTSPVTWDDNYKTRLRQRHDLLIRRRERLQALTNRGWVEYENGMAARFFPNIYLTRKDALRGGKMIAEINKQLTAIESIW
jgi:hypothetical protein